MRVEDALSKGLFWDANPANLDWNKNALFIIERVLTRGETKDFKILIDHYTKQQIRNAILKSKSLDKKTACFVSHYFNVPINQIHVAPECY